MKPTLLAMIMVAFGVALAAPAAASRPPAAARTDEFSALRNIEQFTLANGLRVVVQTDRSAPVVSIAVAYHVGSRDERPGRTGMAHLFEHLLFSGTQHFDRPFAPALADAGAQLLGATTISDHTIFYETVPVSSLERALFLESERMGFFGPAITQAKIDTEVGVVMSERRIRDTNLGPIEYPLLAGVYPAGHPYRLSGYGTDEDLRAANVADVRTWFADHYRPNNAVLTLVGDVDASVRPLVERYFGALAPGAARTMPTAWVPRATTSIHDVVERNAPTARIFRAWAAPGRMTQEHAELEVLLAYLGQDETSALHRALVADAGLATFVDFRPLGGELASILMLQVHLRPGANVEQAEAIIDRVLGEARAGRIPAGALAAARSQLRASLVSTIAQVNDRARSLAVGALLADDPSFVAHEAAWAANVDPSIATARARAYLTEAHYHLLARPFPSLRAAAADVDRSRLPEIGTPPVPDFPDVEHGRLDNGMEIVLVRRPGAPMVSAAVAFAAGYGADPTGRSGLSALTLESLLADDDAFSPRIRAAQIGVTLSSQTSAGTSLLQMSAPAGAFDEGLALLGRAASRSPGAAAFGSARTRQDVAATRETTDLYRSGERVLLAALFGASHPYAAPLSGAGARADVAAATRDDVEAFRMARLRPDNARLFIVGDLSMEQAQAAARAAFGRWRAPALERPQSTAISAPPRASGHVVIVDRPGSEQTMVLAGALLAPSSEQPQPAEMLAIETLAGSGGSRLSQSLREERGWSYWARGFATPARGPRAVIVAAPVQPEHSADAVHEIAREIAAIAGRGSQPRPPTVAETRTRISRAQLAFPARFLSTDAVLAQLVRDAELGRPDGFAEQEAAAVAQVTPAEVARAAAGLFEGGTVWVIVGDKSRFQNDVAAMNLGPIEIVSP